MPLLPVVPPLVALVLSAGLGAPVAAAGATSTAAGTAAAGVTTVVTVAKAIPRPGWQWPLPGRPPVIRHFDLPQERWNAGHRGVNLAGGAASTVVAPANGVVAFAGMVAGRPVLSILHPNGVRTTYEPVVALVKVGQPVGRGATIGRLLPGHCGTRACLHWGAKRGLDYIDPLSLLTDLQPVLLPQR